MTANVLSAPDSTKPLANSGSATSRAGAMPPPMHGWPMGMVTSTLTVARRNADAEGAEWRAPRATAMTSAAPSVAASQGWPGLLDSCVIDALRDEAATLRNALSHLCPP